MGQQGSTNFGGRFAKFKEKASELFRGKNKRNGGEQQQGTELRELSRPRTRPGALPPQPPMFPRPQRGRVTFVGSCGPGDRPGETPPLPEAWNREHDLAICYMDRRGVYLPDLVRKLKSSYPELKGVLNEAMVDKRLRQLDQQPDIDYFRSNELYNRTRLAALRSDERDGSPRE